MEQFSLDKWLQDKSRKVITRNGHEAEIIHDKSPVVAIINGTAYNFENDGSFKSNRNASHSYDLFFADEEEILTEFEKDLQIIISEASHWTSDDGSISTYCQFGDKEIKKISGQLLDLARKEILKSLPKWKKTTEKKEMDYYVALYEDEERVVLSTELCKGEYYLELNDLKTLPKEK